MDVWIKRVVGSFPPLTDEQCELLELIFRGHGRTVTGSLMALRASGGRPILPCRAPQLFSAVAQWPGKVGVIDGRAAGEQLVDDVVTDAQQKTRLVISPISRSNANAASAPKPPTRSAQAVISRVLGLKVKSPS